MPNSELANIIKAVMQEEFQSIRQEMRDFQKGIYQEIRSIVREELQPVNTRLDTLETGQRELRQGQEELRQDVQGLKKGQAAIENTLNDLRAINCGTHKKIFNQLDAIWDDIKLLSVEGKKAIR